MLSLNIASENYLNDSEGHSYWQLVIGSFITTMHLLMHHVLCRDFLMKRLITQVTQPPYSPDLACCNFWFFPKLKSPLKGKTFQTVNEIQENMMGQLMAIGRTVWGPRCLQWRELRCHCPLYNVSCFLYLLQCLCFSYLIAGYTMNIHTRTSICVCVCASK